MEKITFCIPTKNNLRYLKNSIRSIKQNSTHDHDIIVYVDSDNDGTEDWLIDNQIKYIKNESGVPKGIAYAYNRCIEASETKIVCTFHADMFMAKGFDTNIIKYLKNKHVAVCATRIEPPLHPVGKEKILMDFGMYPEDFNEDGFNAFVEEQKKVYENKITFGIFAPWACYKESVLSMGLHDEDFHSYHEDSDIFNRMLLGRMPMQLIQSRDAFVYHLTCRGGQFQDGIEKVTDDEAFHKMRNNAAKHYLRKWGSWMKNNEYQYPIVSPKYNVAFVVRNCNLQALEALETWCDRIYIEDEMQVIKDAYFEKEQPLTKFDLRKRVLDLNHNDPIGENDIVIEFDLKNLNQQSFDIIQRLPEIIKESGDIGEFELDIFKITINSLEEYQNNLISLDDPYYTDKLIKK